MAFVIKAFSILEYSDSNKVTGDKFVAIFNPYTDTTKCFGFGKIKIKIHINVLKIPQ